MNGSYELIHDMEPIICRIFYAINYIAYSLSGFDAVKTNKSK